MGRGKGWQEDWSKTRDILSWLWQRPWKMVKGKKSPWRFMKAAHYYYFADIFIPLHKPWSPFTFPERPRGLNLALKWEKLNTRGGLQFSEEVGGLCAERPHNTANMPCCSQHCELTFSKNLLQSIAYIPNTSYLRFWFQISSHWIIVLINDYGWVSL